MLRAALLAASVVLLAGAVWLLLGAGSGGAGRRTATPPQDKAAETETKAKAKRGTRETPGLAALINRPVPRPAESRAPIEPPAVLDDPGRPRSQIEVVSRFESFIADLEAIEQAAPKMSREDKERMYVESTSMLSALTEQFDMQDSDQARYIEEARGLMLGHLSRLGVGPAEPAARPTRHRPAPPQ